jgi:hypothetical protein
LLSIRRAGADVILTYFAIPAAQALSAERFWALLWSLFHLQVDGSGVVKIENKEMFDLSHSHCALGKCGQAELR